jgi:hypothetical protein
MADISALSHSTGEFVFHELFDLPSTRIVVERNDCLSLMPMPPPEPQLSRIVREGLVEIDPGRLKCYGDCG